jgi:small subunit ribosomal protein S13
MLVDNIKRNNIRKKSQNVVRILGNILPNKKKIEIALTYIYGIGRKTALKILTDLNISPNEKINSLEPEDLKVLRNHIEKEAFKYEDNLHRLKRLNIKHLKDIHSFRGQRYEKGLPIRGQRTKTNSRTSRFLFERRKRLKTGKRGKIIF